MSLRANFAWTFAGNAIYAVGQWAILSLIAKLGGAEMLGRYALAAAVAAPVAMLFHLNLRAVLATDAGGQHPFGDYVAVRLGTAVAGMALIAGIAVAAGRSREAAILIVLAGLALMAENVSDTYYGAMQRRERMDQVARSMAARAALSAAGLGAALWLTGNLMAAVGALAAGRLAVLLFYDLPAGSAGERLARRGIRAELRLLRTALPLGLGLMLLSLNGNLPRYAVERYLGTRELGAYAAVASFVNVGGTMVNALGQSFVARLARYFSERDWRGFRRLGARLAGLALAIGAAGVLAAVTIGKLSLRILFRADFQAYAGLLAAVMAAAVLAYVASALGYVVTSTRAFDAQLPLFGAGAAVCGLASWLLIPRFGLAGAPMALALASSVQIAGELLVLLRTLRRAEAGR